MSKREKEFRALKIFLVRKLSLRQHQRGVMMVVGSQSQNTSNTRLGGHLRDEEMNMKRFPSVQIGLVMFSIKAGDKKLESAPDT